MKIKYCKKCQRETQRLVSSGRCKPCNDVNNDAYKLVNPDKLKAIAKAWRKANPDKYKASIAASRAKNPEYKAQARARSAAWRLANPNPRVNT
tara:strand:- start:21 stop:299 length:279 start_codon:yes stop_codon:yes gene_type:complete